MNEVKEIRSIWHLFSDGLITYQEFQEKMDSLGVQIPLFQGVQQIGHFKKEVCYVECSEHKVVQGGYQHL